MLFNPRANTNWIGLTRYPCDIYSNKSSVENRPCYRWKWAIIFDYIIDALFVMDILINFNTSYDATPDNDTDDVLRQIDAK